VAGPTKSAPLGPRLSSPTERLRVLFLSNEESGEHAGQRDGFARLEADGSIESFAWASPKMIAKSKGDEAALREVLDMIGTKRPNVILALTPSGFPFTESWFQAVAALPSPPILLLWEGDPWGRWSKPPTPEVRLWWTAADIVFSVAIGKQRSLIERHGGRDVRFAPHTYDHVRHSEEEENEPPAGGDVSEVAVIANWWGRRYLPSRLPGARQRFQLVRALQKDERIPLAVYGANWTGRGVRGMVAYDDQAAAARDALITANWDHFPDYGAYASNRLPISLLAGRVHVTTLHPGFEWLPGPEKGLFLEPTVRAAVRRVRELLDRPREEVLELGLAGHRWVRHRLSDRELTRYMLGAVDERLLRDLPDDPWARIPA
jgi:hypothetical protein